MAHPGRLSACLAIACAGAVLALPGVAGAQGRASIVWARGRDRATLSALEGTEIARCAPDHVVRVRVAIHADGRATVPASLDVSHIAVRDCVARAVHAMRFEPGPIATVEIALGDRDAMRDAEEQRSRDRARRRFHVALAALERRGALGEGVLRQVIERHLPELRFCYEQQLLRTPDTAGTLVLRFVVSQTGAVLSTALAQGVAAQLDACFGSAVRRWTFPAPEGGGIVVVSATFELRPPPAE